MSTWRPSTWDLHSESAPGARGVQRQRPRREVGPWRSSLPGRRRCGATTSRTTVTRIVSLSPGLCRCHQGCVVVTKVMSPSPRLCRRHQRCVVVTSVLAGYLRYTAGAARFPWCRGVFPGDARFPWRRVTRDDDVVTDDSARRHQRCVVVTRVLAGYLRYTAGIAHFPWCRAFSLVSRGFPGDA